MNEQKYLTELTIDGVTYTLTPKAPPEPKPLYPNAKRWERVEYGAAYWCIDSDGCILKCHDYYYAEDDVLYENGNYYRSEREAEHARDTQTLMNQIQRWRDLNDPIVLDWPRGEPSKYYFYYSYGRKDIIIDWTGRYRVPNITYFSSRDLAEQCLAATEEDYTQTYGERLKALFEVE